MELYNSVLVTCSCVFQMNICLGFSVESLSSFYWCFLVNVKHYINSFDFLHHHVLLITRYLLTLFILWITLIPSVTDGLLWFQYDLHSTWSLYQSCLLCSSKWSIQRCLCVINKTYWVFLLGATLFNFFFFLLNPCLFWILLLRDPCISCSLFSDWKHSDLLSGSPFTKFPHKRTTLETILKKIASLLTYFMCF